jgi:hypothetical protein
MFDSEKLECPETKHKRPERKYIGTGCGWVALVELNTDLREAEEQGERLRATLYEQNAEFGETPAAKVSPSLTIDELIAVLPSNKMFVDGLKEKFDLPGGMRVDDVPGGVDSSPRAQAFIARASEASKDEAACRERDEFLLRFGQRSMEEWDDFYKRAEEKENDALVALLKQYYRSGNEYRIDVIYGSFTAVQVAEEMVSNYQKMGYAKSAIVSPDEAEKEDPALANFCARYSQQEATSSQRQWLAGAVAVRRPGGCIVPNFFEAFLEQLNVRMGTYKNEVGKEKPCLRVRYGREVKGVLYSEPDTIKGLSVFDKARGVSYEKSEKPSLYKHTNYVFTPGESVGTLSGLGFKEPASGGFAGASLRLRVPYEKMTAELKKKYASTLCYREVHKPRPGPEVVLAYQLTSEGASIILKLAGTKAFYGDVKPEASQEFAQNRGHLLLQTMNELHPDLLTAASGENTAEKNLTKEDLARLIASGVLQLWVGRRAVAYDKSPTLGALYRADDGTKVSNAHCTTHLGSGGVSAAHFAVKVARHKTEEPADAFVAEALERTRSCR